MAQSVDPLQSFTYLVENIPRWLVKLDELNTQCDEQYERFYKLTKYGQVKLTRKKKNDSTESLRPGKEAISPTAAHEQFLRQVPDLGCPNKDILNLLPPVQTQTPESPAAELNRKRKPQSDLSISSGPNRYRTKSMIVVYYDSTLQEAFEAIVKNVANARSTLRKGRTTATFQARMASMGLPAENSLPAIGDPINPKAILSSFGQTRVPGGAGGSTDKKRYRSFDEADRDLEEAQNLSEKAAHQFLRDGDSKIEIEGMRRRFKAVVALAEKEVEKMKFSAGEDIGTSEMNTSAGSKICPSALQSGPFDSDEVTTHSKVEPSPFSSAVQPLLSTSITTAPTRSSDLPSTIQTDLLPPSTSAKQFNFAATGMIEVDDAASDASSVKVDMNAIRRVSRRV